MALTGEEYILVYSGSDGDGGYGGDVRPVSPRLQVKDLGDVSDNTQLLLSSGGFTITKQDFFDLEPPSDTAVRISLLSGGMSFTQADYIEYLNVSGGDGRPGPGIVTGLTITKRGQGYSVGDTPAIVTDADTISGLIRVLAVDHFGGIVSARLIHTSLGISDGPHALTYDGSAAEIFVTNRRDTVAGVIHGYAVQDGGSDWRIGDLFTLEDGTEVARGIVTNTSIGFIPDPTIVSVYAGETKAITSGTQGTGVVLVAGDVTAHTPPGRRVKIAGSTGNNATYYVSASSYASTHTSLTLKGPPKGTITLSGLPSADDTVTIAGVTLTFVAASPGDGEVLIGADITATSTSLAAVINTYDGLNEFLIATHAVGVTTVTFHEADPDGETLTLAKSGTNIAVSGAHLVAVTALSSSTMDGNIVIGPEIVVNASNGGDPLDPDVPWRFTGIFDDDSNVRLDALVADYDPILSDDPLKPDQYKLFISPYSPGDLTVLTTLDLPNAIGNQVGAVTSVDMYVFGAGFDSDIYAATLVGSGGTGLSIEVNSVLGFEP